MITFLNSLVDVEGTYQLFKFLTHNKIKKQLTSRHSSSVFS